MIARANLWDDEGGRKDGLPGYNKFAGTDNPRHKRAIRALWYRSLYREELDRAAGCSNGPELVAELRRRGLKIPCVMELIRDRDGKLTRRGLYILNVNDRRKIQEWVASGGQL